MHTHTKSTTKTYHLAYIFTHTQDFTQAPVVTPYVAVSNDRAAAVVVSGRRPQAADDEDDEVKPWLAYVVEFRSR